MVNRILVATDGSEHARKALDYASDIASKYNAKLYVVHVVSDKGIPEDLLQYIKVEGIEEPPESVYLQKVGEGIIGVAEKEIAERGVKEVQSVVLQGDPAEKILQFARDNGVDMIVIGSRGLGSVKGMFLGSVSNKVCHAADCTCVTIK
jgi:nucleotide-binding universal stress UspA family protein